MNKLNDSKLLKKIRKKVKKALGIRYLSKRTVEQDTILSELKYLTIGMADFLLDDKFSTKEEYLESVNTFLSLEAKTYDYKAPLVYSFGNMQLIGGRIRLRHEINDFEERYSIDNLRQQINPND